MSRTFKIIVVCAGAAALLLAAAYSALERAERARAERLDWPDINSLALADGPLAAERAIENKLAEHPNDALLHYYQARVYYEEGRAPEALRAADDAIRLGYAQEISHLLKALVYGRLLGDYARQRELASKALAYDPTYDDAYFVRAEAARSLGDHRACAADAAAFSRLQPEEASGYELSLRCLALAGDLAGAEAAGLKALKLKPGGHETLWRLGRVYAARGLHGRAVKKFAEAIRLSGGRPDYYLDRAASCAELGDHSCAAWDYASAMDWKEISGYASYYYLLGSAMHRAGELGPALEAAGKAVELEPAGSGNYLLRARLRAETGDLAGAGRDLRAAQALAPGCCAELARRLASAAPSSKSGK